MSTALPEGLRAQRDYIEKLEADAFGWDILVGDAFVRGMRDIGYKSTSFALAEIIDNSIQADATRVDVVFGFDRGTKPVRIAVVDDGHGMDPQMVRAALVWGAGTRAEDRSGFGKYGYGLPSASVSQCHRVTVYSKTTDGEWHSAYLDIDEIARGEWSKNNRIEMPPARPAELPAFVRKSLADSKRLDSFEHGTVVVWENLDRVDYKRREALRNALVTDLGVLYRNYLVSTPMLVDGVVVEPCDPLFLTEGFRYYALDEDRAVEMDPAIVEVKDKESGKTVGSMRVRYAVMPATFFRKPEFKRTNRPGNRRNSMNERLEIADANNGIIFVRNGRQIDVLRPPRSLGTINATTDRFWAVEVDFDASLDEFFSITTAKQQVRPDERIWDILKDKANLFQTISTMRAAYSKEAKRIAADAEKTNSGQRASVEAIKAADKFRTSKRPAQTPERQREAKENLGSEARKRASKAGISPEVVEQELVAGREGRTHIVDTEDMPGAPFYRCVQEGGTRVLYLNVAHPFYADLYAGPSSSPRLRAGLEVLLWTLGNAEVDADPDSDRRIFYERERASVWSANLSDALAMLQKIAPVESEGADDESVAA